MNIKLSIIFTTAVCALTTTCAFASDPETKYKSSNNLPKLVRYISNSTPKNAPDLSASVAFAKCYMGGALGDTTPNNDRIVAHDLHTNIQKYLSNSQVIKYPDGYDNKIERGILVLSSETLSKNYDLNELHEKTNLEDAFPQLTNACPLP